MVPESDAPHMVTAPADREIVSTRVFDASRERVWAVWTQPEHVARWWGPRGFTNTIHEMDVRPGGDWRLVMHGPDGTDYPNRMTFEEVVEPERIVYLHHAVREGELFHFRATVTFAERSGGTEVTMRMAFPSPHARDFAEEHGAAEGLEQTLERLGEHLSGNTGE